MNLRGAALPMTMMLLAGALAPLRAQGVAYEGGISVATGRYFYTTRTTSWTISSGIAYTPGRLIFRAAVPVYVQNSSLIRGAGSGMMLGGAGGGSGGGGGMMGGGGTGSMMGGGGAMPNFRPLAHAIRGIRLRVVSPPLVATGHGRVRPLRFDFGGYTPNGWSGTPLRGAVNPAAA